jgi:trk system potassium uptake protein TrkH
MLIVLAYIVTFTIGTTAGVLFGYPLELAAFESASATGNVGLSAGITSPFMPDTLKVVYIIIMWMARLEFMSVFALFAYIFYGVRRKWSQ